MKKMKQIMAWIGIIILVALYLITFLLGIFGNEHTKGMLMASIICTVVVPCLMYGMILIARVLSKDSTNENTSDQVTSSTNTK